MASWSGECVGSIYHVLPDRTYLFGIARRHLDVVILPVGRIHLRMDMRGAVDDREQLRWLAAQLGVADAVDRFSGIRRLVIIPRPAIEREPPPIGGTV